MRVLLILLVLIPFLGEAHGQTLKGITLGEKYKGDTIIQPTVGGHQGKITIKMKNDKIVDGILFLANGLLTMRQITQFRDAIDQEFGTVLIERWSDFGEISWVDNTDCYATYIVTADWAEEAQTYRMAFVIMHSQTVGKEDRDNGDLSDDF